MCVRRAAGFVREILSGDADYRCAICDVDRTVGKSGVRKRTLGGWFGEA